jgi:predicted  nucleic acid-binding Zn-ribbon protein
MFKYHCPACGAEAYSSASYTTVGGCPSCGSPLAEDAIARVPEPDALPRSPPCGRPTYDSAGNDYRLTLASTEASRWGGSHAWT